MPPTSLWIGQYDGVSITPSGYSFASPPPAGWKPFASNSRINTPIAASPAIDTNSAAVVTWLCTTLNGPFDKYIRAGTTDDYEYPLYFYDPNEPGVTTVRGKMHGGASQPAYLAGLGAAHGTRGGPDGVNTVHNRIFPRPPYLIPAGGTDGIAVVVGGNYAIEMWQTDNWSPGSGRIGFQAAAITDMTGDGVNQSGSASASGLSVTGGNARLVDIQNGLIPHALKMQVRWVGSQYRAPAISRATIDPAVVSVGDATDIARPPTGARFRLNYTDGEIAALSVPTWKKTILTCMKNYGMYVTDTIGGQSWTINLDSGTPYVARGQTDPWETFAIAQSWSPADPDGYIFPLKAGVDWAGKLQMLADGE